MWLLFLTLAVFLRASVAEKVELLERAEPAVCMPESHLVALKENSQYANNHTVSIIPHCVRVKRCGGCCDSELRTCKPTHIKFHKYKITVSSFVKGKAIAISDTIEIAEHTACQCTCNITAKDCVEGQTYDESWCRCVAPTIC